MKPVTKRTIHCCGCGEEVEARLTNGEEIYRHRPDLHKLPFWKCPVCGNYVGCHHKSSNPTRPLGCIPTQELKRARNHIHALIDPVWKTRKVSRSKLYRMIGEGLGYEYHTAEIRTIEQAREVWKVAKRIVLSL